MIQNTLAAPIFFAALFLAACTQETPAPPQSEAAFDAELVLRPVRGDDGEVSSVQVEAVYSKTFAADAPFALRAPIVYAGRGGMADSVDDLVVRDASGDVELRIENDEEHPGGFPYYRHWRAARDVTAPVTVSYRMRPARELIRGPQFDFYAHGGGVSSGGMALFVLPETEETARWRVDWDLGGLAGDSIAASTHGEGDLDLEGPPDKLIQAYYMAGPVGRYADPSTDGAFSAYWLGRTPFDADSEMEWAAEAYAFLRDFFRDEETPSYKVFIRAVDAEQGLGGTALQNSFMVGVAAPKSNATEPKATAPRGTIFHEMGHMFVGGLSGEGPAGAPWFAEGLNVHYTRLLLLRSGLAPVSDYLDSINASARGYYASPFRNASEEELTALGFSTGIGAGSAQNIAYTRGGLYFADMDAKIRAASNGARGLDDVILPLFEQRRNGEPLTREMLIEALTQEIGPAARETFDAVVARGETIVPASEAFGPCFERRETQYETADGRVEGYEWTRIADTPDAECRDW